MYVCMYVYKYVSFMPGRVGAAALPATNPDGVCMVVCVCVRAYVCMYACICVMYVGMYVGMHVYML